MSPGIQDANLAALECKDWHAGPPIVTATRRHPKHLLAPAAGKAHPATCAIGFLNQSRHAGGFFHRPKSSQYSHRIWNENWVIVEVAYRPENNLGRNECVISLR
jgi:hypothetical protein